jgi:hypothetical protein
MIFKLEFLISLTVQKKKELSNFKNSLAAQYKTVIGKDIRLPRGCIPNSFLIEDAIIDHPLKDIQQMHQVSRLSITIFSCGYMASHQGIEN